MTGLPELPLPQQLPYTLPTSADPGPRRHQRLAVEESWGCRSRDSQKHQFLSHRPELEEALVHVEGPNPVVLRARQRQRRQVPKRPRHSAVVWRPQACQGHLWPVPEVVLGPENWSGAQVNADGDLLAHLRWEASKNRTVLEVPLLCLVLWHLVGRGVLAFNLCLSAERPCQSRGYRSGNSAYLSHDP